MQPYSIGCAGIMSQWVLSTCVNGLYTRKCELTCIESKALKFQLKLALFADITFHKHMYFQIGFSPYMEEGGMMCVLAYRCK